MSGSRRSAEKEAFWRLVVDGQKASGLSVRAFCKRESVSEPSFYAWRKELAKREQSESQDRPASESSQLIPVNVVGQSSGNGKFESSLSRSSDPSVSLDPSGTLDSGRVQTSVRSSARCFAASRLVASGRVL